MIEAALDWEMYEKVTKYIYQTLGEKAGVKIIGHGKDCKVEGKSGVKHQIDVLASHSDGIHNYTTAIECKYWKDNVSKDTIMKVAAIIEDAKIDKGVIVSKQGYTPDAIEFAKYKNIGLVELREMQEQDWEGRPSITMLKSTVRRPEIIKIKILPSLFNRASVDQENIQTDKLTLILYSGETVSIEKYLDEFKKELHHHPIGKIIDKRISLPLSRLINAASGNILYIDGFIIKGKLTELPGLKFYPIDEVWLLMKSIFEEKSFTISKKGIIREDGKDVSIGFKS